MERFDFLVIGAGIAGLSAAIRLADAGTVLVVTKEELAESNTAYAQGGIAVAMGGDLERAAFAEREDGSDLGAQLSRLFEVLNTPEGRRQRTLDEDLATFPYVNGELFAERLGFADFNRDMRKALVACCHFQWARISPAVFGSLFQGIMDDKERRQQGAHYTSERDIMKVVRSLFLDELRAEFDALRADRSTRRRARLRTVELELVKEIHADNPQLVLDIRHIVQVDVDQFYGIEISEWPVRIAEVAMWLMDHQMNVEVAEAFGQSFRRLPLKSTPHIVRDNAVRLDWRTVLPSDRCSYVLGNPPFVGKKEQNAEQKSDMSQVWSGVQGAGVLDYVTCWYRRAA